MHIIRVSHLFYPDIISDYLFKLSINQVKRGNKVDVFTWNKNERYSKDVIIDDFTIHRLRGVNLSIKGLINDYPYLPNLSNKIKELEPEIIHIESHLFPTTIQSLRIAKRLGIPCIVTIHGVMSKRGIALNLAQYSYLLTLGSWIFKNSNKIICLTKSDAEEIVRYGCPPKKIRIIPNAIDTELFKFKKDRRNNLIIWTGRFVQEKRVDCLIKAAKIITSRFKNVKFLLIGYGPLKSEMMNLAYNYELLNNSVFFLGPFDRDRIPNILGKATIFVYPSIKEGLPISILEAMACGTPVIGSDVSGIKDLIINGHNGILVPPSNPSELANAIIKLLNDEELRNKFSKNCRQLVIEKYNWNTVINNIEKIYNEATWEIK